MISPQRKREEECTAFTGGSNLRIYQASNLPCELKIRRHEVRVLRVVPQPVHERLAGLLVVALVRVARRQRHQRLLAGGVQLEALFQGADRVWILKMFFAKIRI